jgi:hypothetical protein
MKHVSLSLVCIFFTVPYCTHTQKKKPNNKLGLFPGKLAQIIQMENHVPLLREIILKRIKLLRF